ncbi:MAG: thioredoxin family protein [Phycisphaerales bacterium]|nr:thioredoxin family protein [Phycisphaerales bacterium]
MNAYFIGLFAVVLSVGLFAVAQGDGPSAAIGQQAPSFALQDQNGKPVSLEDFAGRIVVLEWVNPDCPFVKRHYEEQTMTHLASEFHDKDVVWLGIATGHTANAPSLQHFAHQHNLSWPILLDHDGAVARAYGAKTTPHMFIIGRDGTLLYRGGIDNDPAGDKADRINYVREALDEITSDKPVSHPDTKPYGCSVKYSH